MNASDIMTPSPACCSPNDSLQDAAQIMRDSDCGAVPVVNDGRIVGIVTDRDLALRALAEGKGADTKVGDVSTTDLCCCNPGDDIRDVQKMMAEKQIRRIPVVDADGCCIGIVSQADLALAAMNGERVSESEVAMVVEHISKPNTNIK